MRPSELEFQASVNYLKWVQGIKPRSLARATSVLYHWAVSPVPLSKPTFGFYVPFFDRHRVYLDWAITWLQSSLHVPNFSTIPIKQYLHFFLSTPRSNLTVPSVSVNFNTLGASCKWDHIISVLLCLAYFISTMPLRFIHVVPCVSIFMPWW